MVKKVAIIGAGPSGLLLAHYLLRRHQEYQIDIYERFSDPRIIALSKSRTFPVTLNDRGIAALEKIEGLSAALLAISMKITGSIAHQKHGKVTAIERNKPLYAIDRNSLATLLLEKLVEKSQSNKLNIHFNCQCSEVDFSAKKLVLQNQEDSFTENYDLLIGADGARSVVRKYFLNTELFEYEQKYLPNDYKSIFLHSEQVKTNLKSGKIHTWRLDDGTAIIMLHEPDGKMSGIISFNRHQNQVSHLSTKEEVLQLFQENFPEISQLITESEIKDFLARPISTVLTIRCNRYHYGDSVLLIGDAAHAVSPSIGQGCNSALEDVVIFDNLLDEYSDIATAIEQFTIRRQPDAHALAELSDYTFPTSKRLFVEFLFRESIAKSLHKLLPKQFPPSLLESLSANTISYSEILHTYKNWISKVKQAKL